MNPPRSLILGLGNLLLRDDGIGVHAARVLAADPPAGVEVADVGTAVLHALDFLETAEHVVAIDALRGGGPPGTVYLVSPDELRFGRRPGSLHALGLVEALQRLSPHRAGKVELWLLGVEPAEIGYGMELSPALARALPEVVAAARGLAMRWTDAAAAKEPVEAAS